MHDKMLNWKTWME